jgi:hypothetical protein
LQYGGYAFYSLNKNENHQDLHRLTEKQMAAILLFTAWPEKHEGPGDVGENEGLGGLVNQVQTFHATSEKNDVDGIEDQAHADRRHALEDRSLGSRSPSSLS